MHSPLDLTQNMFFKYLEKGMIYHEACWVSKWDLLLMHHTSIANQKYKENINLTLKNLRHPHLNNVIFSYLNINSIGNKVGYLNK